VALHGDQLHLSVSREEGVVTNVSLAAPFVVAKDAEQARGQLADTLSNRHHHGLQHRRTDRL
jgi:hypothetical protein